jgi:hypothetical protein
MTLILPQLPPAFGGHVLEPGGGFAFSEPDRARELLTRRAGAYCLVHWPLRLIACGEGHNVFGRYEERRGWSISMRDGTAPAAQYRRLKVPEPFALVVAARCYGAVGFELFLLSDDEQFQPGTPGGCAARQGAEPSLFEWADRLVSFQSCNRQRGWRECVHMRAA